MKCRHDQVIHICQAEFSVPSPGTDLTASSVFFFFLYFIDFSIIMYYFTPTKNNKQNKNDNKGKELYLSVYCPSSAGALIGDTVN